MWPGLTEKLVSQHLPLSMATVRGHIHKEKQRLQSTTTRSQQHRQTIQVEEETVNDEDAFPYPATPNRKYNQAAYVVIKHKEITTVYQDLMGRFPIQSSRGNEYVLVRYHYDANCILWHLVKDRTASLLTTEW